MPDKGTDTWSGIPQGATACSAQIEGRLDASYWPRGSRCRELHSRNWLHCGLWQLSFKHNTFRWQISWTSQKHGVTESNHHLNRNSRLLCLRMHCWMSWGTATNRDHSRTYLEFWCLQESRLAVSLCAHIKYSYPLQIPFCHRSSQRGWADQSSLRGWGHFCSDSRHTWCSFPFSCTWCTSARTSIRYKFFCASKLFESPDWIMHPCRSLLVKARQWLFKTERHFPCAPLWSVSRYKR